MKQESIKPLLFSGSEKKIKFRDLDPNFALLNCPYNFTSQCTMGRCDCKPVTQTKINDHETKNN